MHSALIVTLAAAALGWADISVTTNRSGSASAPWHQRVLANLSRPTDRTQETLRRYELDREYRWNSQNALVRLEKLARGRPEPELVFALAELSWLEAPSTTAGGSPRGCNTTSTRWPTPSTSCSTPIWPPVGSRPTPGS